MQLELTFGNEDRVLPSVRAFISETLRQLPLPVDDSQHLKAIVLEAVGEAIRHAYPDGEDGDIKLSILDDHGKLEIRIRDYGLPQDVERMEERLHSASATALFGHELANLVDEVHWLAFGPQGKALQIIKWLHATHIAEHTKAGTLEPLREDAALSREQEYVVRRMQPADAVQVSQLMYRAYGNTYFNADVYYPERIAAQNAKGSLLSVVAEDEDGQVVGHYALEFCQDGPVAEGGQAVVNPAHRGRGLLNRMKATMLEFAERLDLVGWFANAVAVHTQTQKSNATHGGHLTAVNLGISPKTERFRNLAEELSQRVTCLVYFHWLKQPTPRKVHAPAHHHEIIATIYEELQCPMEFGEARPPSGSGILAVKMDAGEAAAFVRVEQAGEDTLHSIRRAKRTSIEQSRAEVVFVELPLADPAIPRIAEELQADGFGFIGVTPHFSARGDLLQLVYLVEPLARENIKTFDDSGDHLVNYALDEQKRVREL